MASSSSELRTPPLSVEHTKGVNGLEKVTLRVPRGFSAEVYFSLFCTSSHEFAALILILAFLRFLSFF